MNTIYIDSKDGTTKVSIVEDDRLVEYYKEDSNKSKLLGNVYRGRVVNVLQGMEAAFVDIGVGRNAYLFIKDALNREQLLLKESITIGDLLKKGDEIIVQVIKEPLENKGPKVTTHISIPGRHMVLTPYSSKINVSKKIKEKDELTRLKLLGREIMIDQMGMIFRTVSSEKDPLVLKEEYEELVKIYVDIQNEKNFLPTPKLLYRELDLVEQTIRDYFNVSSTEIVVNDKDIYKYIINLDNLGDTNFSNKIKYQSDYDMEYHMNIQIDMKDALSRRVNLPSGGYIVIDETEALTAIDVNTGRYVGTLTLEDTILRTNIEASIEISRQLRLRDIGGIIIIDFIDMKKKEFVDIVMGKLETAFKKDKNKPYIVDITKLSLVEVVRKKNRPTLDTKTTYICPTCNGRGRIRKNEAWQQVLNLLNYFGVEPLNMGFKA